MTAKQYEVVRAWRWTDPQTGKDTHYAVGDPYAGSMDNPHLLDPAGPDGNGPLIAEKSAPDKSAAEKSPPEKSASDPKEK